MHFFVFLFYFISLSYVVIAFKFIDQQTDHNKFEPKLTSLRLVNT